MKKAAIGLMMAVFFAQLAGCKKSSETCNTAAGTADSYAKSLFFSYQTGSYWIYQDSVGNIDSSFIISSSCGLVYPNCFEDCNSIISSSIANNSLYIEAGSGEPSRLDITYDENGPLNEDCFIIWFLNGALDTGIASSSPFEFTNLTNYSVNQYTFCHAVKITTSECSIGYIVVVPDTGIVEKTGMAGTPLKVVRFSIKN